MMTTAVTSGRTAGSMLGRIWSPSRDQAWFVRSSPSTTPTKTPTTSPSRIEPTIWRPVAPTTLRTTVTAIATASALKTRTPQPIEPNSHSPTKSALPTGMRIATNRAATKAIPPAVAKRLISAPISANSALASARCAWMSRTNDARVAPNCWRRRRDLGRLRAAPTARTRCRRLLRRIAGPWAARCPDRPWAKRRATDRPGSTSRATRARGTSGDHSSGPPGAHFTQPTV